MLSSLVQTSGLKGSFSPTLSRFWVTGRCHHTLLISLGWSLLTPSLLCGVLPCSQWSRISQYMFLFSSLHWVLTDVCYPGSSQRCLFCTKWGGSKPTIPSLQIGEFGNRFVFVFLSFFPSPVFHKVFGCVFERFFSNVNLLLFRFSVCHLILNS